MEKPKRSFEFRISKKVAELTQVVHMLFTRNHEKEVEIEALKGAYEYEIELVIADAKSKLATLEKQVSDIREQNSSKLSHEIEIRALQEQYEKNLKNVEVLLHEEKTECQNLRDLLINAQSDIEKLKQGVSEQLTYKNEDISKRDTELDKLRKHSSALERRLRDVGKDINVSIRDGERNTMKLQDELSHLHSALDESHRNRELLISRNKQLETDLKTSKQVFNRKLAEVVSSQAGRLSKSAHHSESEELDRLRKEIKKYRLELSNRDWNFNRMFTEKQPIFVDSRATPNVSHSQTPPTASSMNTHPASASCVRERSFSQIISIPPDDKKSLLQRPCSAATFGSQLPTLSQSTNRSRMTRLEKPKPLPKELLYSR